MQPHFILDPIFRHISKTTHNFCIIDLDLKLKIFENVPVLTKSLTGIDEIVTNTIMESLTGSDELRTVIDEINNQANKLAFSQNRFMWFVNVYLLYVLYDVCIYRPNAQLTNRLTGQSPKDGQGHREVALQWCEKVCFCSCVHTFFY